MVKSELPLISGSAALRQLNPVNNNRPQSSKLFFPETARKGLHSCNKTDSLGKKSPKKYSWYRSTADEAEGTNKVSSEISITANIFPESSFFSLMQSTLTKILTCRPASFYNSTLFLAFIYT